MALLYAERVRILVARDKAVWTSGEVITAESVRST